MGKLIKFFFVTIGGLAIIVLAAVLVVPKIVDVQKYKPLLMEKVSEATGRKVSLDGDLNLSIFPWVGVSFSDFRLGNPEGYGEKDLVIVKSFEAHVKLMPLLSREVQVDSFILDGPEIYLEKRKDGRTNWDNLGSSSAPKENNTDQTTKAEPAGLGLKSIEVANFTIRDARLKYVDQQQGVTKEVTGLTLQLTDVNLERPISLIFNAVVDGKAVGLKGSIGPLGPKPGEGSLPLDLTISALDQLNAKVKGQLENPTGNLAYKLAIDVANFSPRKLLSALQMEFPVVTSDPAALDALAISMNMAGTAKNVAISDGKMSLDGSTLDFTTNIKNISPLNLFFDGKLNTIDLDRYLPPKAASQAGQGAAAGSSGSGKTAKTDYEPLRKITLDTKMSIGEIKVQGGKLQNIQIHLVANKGVLKFNPVAMELYGGNVASTATVNVQGKSPSTSLEARTTNVQVGPLLKDFAKKDVLEGTLVSNLALSMVGDSPEAIKKSLNGKGELLFTDGAIVGIDLAGMVRNVQASFGLAEKPTEKPRTDFAELRAPFTVKNGLVNTPETALQSPLMRITVKGDANLVTEALDMRVEPKFVATLKGQGDTTERKGLMVPVLVRGTFSKPQFSPDLTAILQGQLPDAESVKKTLEEGLSPDKVLPKDQGKTLEQGIKGLIPQLKIK
ncbi:AsmA family protein [Desulfopila aestuarii]|uniref:AsmA protein n=1 Tax=Desulfopila aestuarii DSM 18488 TaxID=1121416 RepID=A0A1M7Y834_9BACT|nr:AsmA family protein [Desulfopila aestuarii]SHO48793.1 AsmA protein [Desulfopila aestuarii DSM 18488]